MPDADLVPGCHSHVAIERSSHLSPEPEGFPLLSVSLTAIVKPPLSYNYLVKIDQ